MSAAQQFNDGERHCVTAYVTFEREPQRNECLREWHGVGVGLRKRFQFLCGPNPRFLYEDRSLRIVEAPEPSNIMYLNHGYSALNLFGRRVTTSILSTLIIAASFGLIFAAQFAATALSPADIECDDEAEYDPLIADQLDCHCSGQPLSATEAVSAAMGGDSGGDSVCSEWRRRYVYGKGLKLMSSVIIVAVNMVLLKVIKVLIEKEKHSTVSSQQSALAQKLFLSQFVNTAITILVLNADLGPLGLPSLSPLDTAYSVDFEASWSLDIGNAIVTTLVIGCLNPHFAPLLKMKWQQRSREKVRTQFTEHRLSSIFSP